MMRTLAPIAIATCLACNGHLDVFDLDAGSTMNGMDASSTDTGEHTGVKVVPADILFVVDNSGSMADEQVNLAVNFQSFVDQTIGAAEYRIGVVTTDLSLSGGERAGYQMFTYSSTSPYILSNFDATDCHEVPIAHGCFRGPDPATRLINSAQMTRQQQIDAFDQNIRVGTCGGGVEGGLAAMLEALRKTASGECNDGFLRTDANLVIVLISDEDDSNDRPIEEIVDELGQYKPFSQIRVATVVGAVGGQPSQCGIDIGAECGSICNESFPPGSHRSCIRNDDCPGEEICLQNLCENAALQYWELCYSCSFYDSADCCSATSGSRYVDFARAVEARVHAARPEFPIAQCVSLGSRPSCLAESICQSSFGDTLARIARELVVVEP